MESKPLTSYHHGTLRTAVLAAARRSIETTKNGELSLRALAAEVGVSPNAPYRHFPTKESLLAALAADGFKDLTERFSVHDDAPAQARMERCLEEYLQFARESPSLYRLMFGRNLDPLSCDPQLGLQAQACFTALEAAVAQVMNRSPRDPHVRRGAAVVWSLSHGAALLDIDKATSFLDEGERPTAKTLAEMVILGLSVNPR